MITQVQKNFPKISNPSTKQTIPSSETRINSLIAAIFFLSNPKDYENLKELGKTNLLPIIGSYVYPITSNRHISDANSIDLEIIRDFFKNFRKKYGHFGLFKLGNGCTVLSIQDRVKDWLAKKPTPVSKILSEVLSLKDDENLTTSRAYLRKLDGLSEEDFTNWEREDKKALLNQTLNDPIIIDFENEGIKLIPFQVFTYLAINYLNFEGCKVCYLPEEFGNLKNLHSLFLKKNKLRFLPDSFGGLKELRNLNLGHNRLVSLPNSFAGCKRLNKLDLENNELTSLPENFEKLRSLSSVSLDKNRFQSLPEAIKSLQKEQKVEVTFSAQKIQIERLSRNRKRDAEDLQAEKKAKTRATLYLSLDP